MKTWSILFLSLLIVIFLSNIFHSIGFTQELLTGWTSPVVITSSQQKLFSPNLISDDFGNLHLFYTNQDDLTAPASINYIKWDGLNWSYPIDIILDSSANFPQLARAAIDHNQMIHLVWYGDANQIRYAKSPLINAQNAQFWSEPTTIATAMPGQDITISEDGTIYVAYADWPEMGTISIISSANNGENWSSPIIAAIGLPNCTPADIRMAIDKSGRFHLVWTEYSLSQGNPAQGAFYAQSSDGRQTWTAPWKLSPERHGQPGVATLGANEVHLVWRSNIGGDGTFHQRSVDGGLTWFSPDQYMDGGGFSGPPSFAIDSSNRLHYVIGNVYYAMWDGDQLIGYLDLATQAVRDQAAISNGEEAVIASTLGNQLHVVFETDFNRLWYTTKQLNTLAIPTSTTEILQNQEATPVSLPTSTELPRSGATEISQPTRVVLPQSSNQLFADPGSIIMFSALPVLVMMIGLILLISRQRRSK